VSDLLPYITAGGVIVGVIVTLLNYRQSRAARIAAEQATHGVTVVDGKFYDLGRAVDGRLSELLDQTKKLAHAEGKLDEAQAQRDRAAEPQ
jgi:hypothetical protein